MFENTIYSQVIIIDPDMVISPSTASAMYCIVQVQNWDTKKGSPLIYVYLNNPTDNIILLGTLLYTYYLQYSSLERKFWRVISKLEVLDTLFWKRFDILREKVLMHPSIKYSQRWVFRAKK